ncbi:MAG: TolC family protein [Candidatus Hydrogenedentes bacterium]|nr:TolC family protein [Candidatus Hydrogenedentota bacterium]
MRFIRIAVAMCFLFVSIFAWSESESVAPPETPAVSESSTTTPEPAAPDAKPPPSVRELVPTAETEIGERVVEPPADEEGPLTPAPEELLQQKIDLNRIDLDVLYRALEEAPREKTELGLQECVRRALEANQDILVLAYEPLKSDGDVMSAKGEFDPLLRGSTSYTRSTQAASSQVVAFGGISAIETWQSAHQAALGGKLHWGTEYLVSMDLSREENTFNRFVEEWSGGLTLSLTQPLLRGRGQAVNLTRIRVAKNSRRLAEDQLQVLVLNTVAQVVKSYWDLVGAVENVRVRQQALANAERLVQINEKRLEIGTAAAIDVLQAKAGLATRQSELIAARSQVQDAEDVLKKLLDMRENELISPKSIVPTDRPSLAEVPLDEAQSVAKALELRPEIRSGELEIETAQLQRRQAGNQLLPQLDLSGSVLQGGRDHKLREVFYGVRERRDNAYTITLQGSVPIGNRAGRGAYERAAVTAHQAEQRLEKTKQDIVSNIRLALRGVKTSRILVESNRQISALQEVNLAAEEKRLQLGVTTSYQVLQVQEDLIVAQVQEVQAKIASEKALTDLQLAEGSIFETLGIEFQTPEPAKPVTFYRSIRLPELE